MQINTIQIYQRVNLEVMFKQTMLKKYNIAHELGSKPRTQDVLLPEDNNTDFSSMLLPRMIEDGLHVAGFIKPSPIQLKAIPLARCGFDLIVQAKSGTGKTCVFTVAALETLIPESNRLQVLVLAPTREIALQIQDVVKSIGSTQKNLKVRSFIGGIPIHEDKANIPGCQIAVGAPGRIKHLIDDKLLSVDAVRLFVLDEADKLMESAFQDDINAIFSELPDSKQVIACSATYTPELVKFLGNYMQSATHITPGCDPSPVLLGLRHFAYEGDRSCNYLKKMKVKEEQLLKVLSNVPFCQCLIFSNYHTRAESICNVLTKKKFSALWIAGNQDQKTRTSVFTKVKQFEARVLVTTDLTARGLDFEKVNLVINVDLPSDHCTYLHRMGRAGRYGGPGIVITLLFEDEMMKFRRLLGKIGGSYANAYKIPKSGPSSLWSSLWSADLDKLEVVDGIDDIDDLDLKIETIDIKSEPSGSINDDDDYMSIASSTVKIEPEDCEYTISSVCLNEKDKEAECAISSVCLNEKDEEAECASDNDSSIHSSEVEKSLNTENLDFSGLSEFGLKLMRFAKSTNCNSYFQVKESLDEYINSKGVQSDGANRKKLLEPAGTLDCDVAQNFLSNVDYEHKNLRSMCAKATMDHALDWLREDTTDCNRPTPCNIYIDLQANKPKPKEIYPKEGVEDIQEVIESTESKNTENVQQSMDKINKNSKYDNKHRDNIVSVCDFANISFNKEQRSSTPKIKVLELKDREMYSQTSSSDDEQDNDDDDDDEDHHHKKNRKYKIYLPTNVFHKSTACQDHQVELNSEGELNSHEQSNLPKTVSINPVKPTLLEKINSEACNEIEYRIVNNDTYDNKMDFSEEGASKSTYKRSSHNKSKSKKKRRRKQKKNTAGAEASLCESSEQFSFQDSELSEPNLNLLNYPNQLGIDNFHYNQNIPEGLQHWHDMYVSQSAYIKWYVGYNHYIKNMLKPNYC